MTAASPHCLQDLHREMLDNVNRAIDILTFGASRDEAAPRDAVP